MSLEAQLAYIGSSVQSKIDSRRRFHIGSKARSIAKLRRAIEKRLNELSDWDRFITIFMDAHGYTDYDFAYPKPRRLPHKSYKESNDLLNDDPDENVDPPLAPLT